MSPDEAFIMLSDEAVHLMRHSLCYLMRQFTMSPDEAFIMLSDEAVHYVT